MKSILSQGAEALIEIEGVNVLKNRIKKSYRLSFLDQKLRKQRTRREAKLLTKAENIIPVPKIITNDDYSITLELIKGKKLSEHLDKLSNSLKVCKLIGENLAKLHDNNIIHSDLTTSNMILKSDKVYFIDFGLGFESNRLEDKATDLRLIKQAFEAKHSKKSKLYFSSLLKGYYKSKNAKIVLNQLKKVESRGRYKTQY